ncbi:SAM-dependent methyltransferase [Actinomadura meridiana]|uniref:SAM-dependent methyltransferase n=1 Tax=Actinomadura meridiana TaxID=559626 RepID=A0ABP8C1S4_9ACTN
MPDGNVDLKTEIPHSARIYDYLLGGKDNFPADREAAANIVASWTALPTGMRANRKFMARMAHHLAAEHGIRQFLDIGTGLPTSPNLHEVVQAVAPDSRVVYVDNDPIVLVHARALLTSTREGRTAYLDADFLDPDAIIGSVQLRDSLDLERPVAVSLIAILHFMLDDDEVRRIIDRLMEPLAPGSVLALSTTTLDNNPEAVAAGVAAYTAHGIPTKARTRVEVERFFDGLELLDPGVVAVHRWHPDEESAKLDDSMVTIHGGIGRKR